MDLGPSLMLEQINQIKSFPLSVPLIGQLKPTG
jgi:hypothetical protein